MKRGGHHTSHKWISVEVKSGSRKLKTHNVDAVYNSVASSECNLISIFGRARQGKSFLMNCLSGEEQIFHISNAKESCTQGIDISDKWLSVSDFSRIDGGKAYTGRTKVGFVDAEGQGDRGVSYDANLICPILLASECVIFNWKGDLQKDHIAGTLGIMTRAAQNVELSAAERATGRKKFGHLHIVFRDWQAEDTDCDSVYRHLFSLEHTPESAVRDQIRTDVLASFESLTVWLFDAPSDSTAALKTKLTIDKTSEHFRSQLRAFRGKLSSQLNEPTLFAGRPLTGRNMGRLVQLIADSLNNGHPVMPHSAYVSMMRSEVDQIRGRLESDMQDAAERELHAIGKTVHNERFLSEQDAVDGFEDHLNKIILEFNEECARTVGDLAPDMHSSVMADTPAAVSRAQNTARSTFLSKYKGMFTQWLLGAKRRAEDAYTSGISHLEKSKFPLAEAAVDGELSKILRSAVAMLHVDVHNRDGKHPEVQDAVKNLNTLHELRGAAFRRSNSERLRRIDEELNAEVEKSIGLMRMDVDEKIRSLTSDVKGTGYPLQVLEDKLTERYFKLEGKLVKSMEGGPFAEVVRERFEAACKRMHTDVCKSYQQAMRKAFESAATRVAVELEQELPIAAADAIREGTPKKTTGVGVAAVAPIDLDAHDVKNALNLLTQKLIQSALHSVSSWSDELHHREEIVYKPLTAKAEAITDGLLKNIRLKRAADQRQREEAEERARLEREERERERQRIRAAEQAAAEAAARAAAAEEEERLRQERLNTASKALEEKEAARRAAEAEAEAEAQAQAAAVAEMAVDDDEEEEDDEEDEEEQSPMGRGARKAAAKSISEQRKDALNWAKENFPNPKVSKGKGGRGKKNAVEKSVEQQRADAARWRDEQLLKGKMGKGSTGDEAAGAADEDDGADAQPVAGGRRRSSAAGGGSAASVAAAASTPKKVDVLAAAREEMKKKQQEALQARISKLKK